MTPEHLSEETLLQYRFDTLGRTEAPAAAEHLRRCAECSARYAELCRRVEALDAYGAEPEDGEALVQRAVEAARGAEAAPAPAPERRPRPAPRETVELPRPPPEPERPPLLEWLGVRPGASARWARLAMAAALLLSTSYLGGGQLYHANRTARVDTRVSVERSLLSGSQALAEVQVVDTGTSLPVPGAEVEVALAGGESAWPLYEGRTDDRGLAAASLQLPSVAAGPYVLEVRSRARGERDLLRIPVQLRRQARVHLSSDKPLYQPGQAIHLRALALEFPGQRALSGEPLLFEVRDPKGNRLTREERKLSRFGVAAASFELAPDVALGEYEVRALAGGAQQVLKVKVDRYTLPKFAVKVVPEKEAYLAGETLRARVEARYFFGKPVGRAEVRATLVTGGRVLGAELKGRADAQGEWSLVAELPPDLAAAGPEGVVIQLAVKDPAGEEEHHRHVLTVSRELLDVELIAEGHALTRGQPSAVYAVVTANGRPARAQVTLEGEGQSVRFSTGERGVGRAMVVAAGARARFAVTAQDDHGRQLRREWVTNVAHRDVTVQADRALYRPGESVRAVVRTAPGLSAAEARVVLSQGGQVVARGQAPISDRQAVVELALPRDLTGSVGLSAVVGPGGGDFPPDGAHGALKWIAVVEPSALAVQISSEPPTSRPGGEVRLRFQVKDSGGKPAPAAIGVAVVDESLFARAAEQPALARAAFLLAPSLLQPRAGISSADLLQARGWGEEDQSAAGLLFSLGTPPISSHRPEQGSLQDKRQEIAAERGRFQAWSRGWSLLAGLVLALAAFAALLQSGSGLGARLAAAAAAGAGMALAFGLSWMVVGAPVLVLVGAMVLRAMSRPWKMALALTLGAAALVVLVQSVTFRAAMPASLAGDDVASRRFQGTTGAQSAVRRSPTARDEGEGEAGVAEAPMAKVPSGKKNLAVVASLEGGDGHGSPPDEKSPPRREVRIRERFPETMYVHPELVAGEDGVAELTLPMADSITSWRVSAFASTANGKIGSADAPLRVFQDFFVDIDAPAALVRGDEAAIAVAVHNYLPEKQTVRLEVEREDWFELMGAPTHGLELQPGAVDGHELRIRALKPGKHRLRVRADGTRLSDAVARELLVSEQGHQETDSVSGQLKPDAVTRVALQVPEQATPGSARMTLKLFPSRAALALDGLQGTLRKPHGCFEQTSSANYPNVLVYEYLRKQGTLTPEVEARAKQLLSVGYQRLLGFEVPGGGFEWFGRAPANQVLTAYGLVQLSDMWRVFPVDEAVIHRTQAFLLQQQQEDGSWEPDRQYLSDGLWRSGFDGRVAVTAYVAWALAESGYRGEPLDRALRFLRQTVDQVDDAYVEALVVAALGRTGHGGQEALASRLVGRGAREEGRVKFAPKGATAYYGRGRAGEVETTALVAQALSAAGREPEVVRGALEHLMASRDPRGAWHSTQATILALRAILMSSVQEKDQAVSVKVNGAAAGSVELKGGSTEPVVVELDGQVRAGANVVELSEGKAPFQVVVSYVLPWRQRGDEEKEPMSLAVEYGRTSFRVGDIVPVRVRVTYRRPEASGMAMVVVGVPAGLAPVMEDLAGLRTAGRIARYEPAVGTISLYLDRLPSGGTVEIPFRLKARSKVKTKGAQSEAYLYYQPEVAARVAPVAVAID